MKCFCLLHKHTLALIGHHRHHHLWPHCSPRGLITHTAPLLRGLSLTVTWTRRRCRIGDTPTVAHNCTHTHICTRTQTKHTKWQPHDCLGFTWLQSPTTPVHVNHRGTHSEDNRYEQGSELDSLIMSSDRRITDPVSVNPKCKRERKIFHVSFIFFLSFKCSSK